MEKILINKTKNTNLGSVEFADSFFSRFRGLMLKKELPSGLVLKIPKGRGKKGSAIHMFFMRIPLDLIFADENKKIVDIVTLDPWATYTPRAPARFVVELKKGSLVSSQTEIGDFIEFE
ncbi:DUF192 domain-containing protein [Methanobacterium alcaliphilum]|uniref:DUF192 domain-containing protein n=1 Tax=Methanobacterium alcaliphilum TaxID=392018 RepID=UPI00200ADF83|nr:DUF192 domain-containing protein [Methanobacterium alcaliphilum]MCK9151097.1 DUF192 domain-containing protein [Methanobacterium alcaliphilum]